MTEAEEDALWNAWSANSAASILIDGQRINEVFSFIKRQLDILRRKQGAMQINFNKFSGEVIDNAAASTIDEEVVQLAVLPPEEHIDTQIPDIAKLSPAELHNRRSSIRASMIVQHQRRQSQGQFMFPIFPEGFDPLEVMNELRDLRAEVTLLRDLQQNNTGVDQKFKALESMVHSQLKEHDRKVDSIVHSLHDQRGQFIQLQTRVESIDSEWKQEVEALRRELAEKVAALELGQVTAAKETDLKLHSLRDILSIHDQHSKSIENKISNLSKRLEEIRAGLDVLPSKYFDNIQAQLSQLYAEKATKSDVDAKADLAIAINKADQADMYRLETVTEELQRRLIALLSETSDRITAMDAKLDRRSDRIVSWCMKQLRKELKAINLDDQGNHDGTDIGKVRCLVCNNVTNQGRDTDIVHGGPQLVHTLRTLHGNGQRPRSRSPPGTGGFDDNINLSPSPPPHNNKHSRLVKLGGSPEVNYADDHAEDPDYIADFQYRTPQQQQQHQQQTATQRFPAMSQTSANRYAAQQAAAPLIQIISHHLPVGAAMHAATNSHQQQHVVNYYKDLEQKFHNPAQQQQLQSGQKKSGQAIIRPADLSQRPRSAPPTKRPMGIGSANGAKLQPMMQSQPAGSTGAAAMLSSTAPSPVAAAIV